MKQFDNRRFMQYARYDLTLNQSFYRNMALVTAALIAGITVLGFMFRWIGIRNLPDANPVFSDGAYTVTWTTFWITCLTGILCVLYAGCIHHPLRTKQSLISVLTLPATNAEKFVWHTVLVLIGGWLLLLGSIVLADGLNALLSLLAGFPADKIYSITAEHLRYYSLTMRLPMAGDLGDMIQDENAKGILSELVILSLASSIATISAFTFGNAVKYRFNIIFTYLALWLLQFVASTLVIICTVAFGEKLVESMTDENALNLIHGTLIGTTVFCVIATIALWWGNWRLYKKAQITSKLNR